ncbi:hypothetical protein SRDD_01790 [Serratia sp. DD3]|nr:hypothetical protein SRDD_01790 [Serratia sp. DD3]
MLSNRRQYQQTFARFGQALAIPATGEGPGLVSQRLVNIKRRAGRQGKVAGTLSLPALSPGHLETQIVIVAICRDMPLTQQIIQRYRIQRVVGEIPGDPISRLDQGIVTGDDFAGFHRWLSIIKATDHQRAIQHRSICNNIRRGSNGDVQR